MRSTHFKQKIKISILDIFRKKPDDRIVYNCTLDGFRPIIKIWIEKFGGVANSDFKKFLTHQVTISYLYGFFIHIWNRLNPKTIDSRNSIFVSVMGTIFRDYYNNLDDFLEYSFEPIVNILNNNLILEEPFNGGIMTGGLYVKQLKNEWPEYVRGKNDVYYKYDKKYYMLLENAAEDFLLKGGDYSK